MADYPKLTFGMVKKKLPALVSQFKPYTLKLRPQEEVACNICYDGKINLGPATYYIPTKSLPKLACQSGIKLGSIHSHRNEDNRFSWVDINTEWGKPGAVEFHCVVSSDLKTRCYVLNKADKTVDFGSYFEKYGKMDQNIADQFLSDAREHWVLAEFEI